MIDVAVEPMVKRLSPVRCGRCNWPVTHMNKAVAGSEAGGLCTRCTRDDRGKPIAVYTYYGVAPSDPVVNGATT